MSLETKGLNLALAGILALPLMSCSTRDKKGSAQMAAPSHAKESTKAVPEISVSVVARQSSYSYKEPVVLDCIIENSTPDEIVLLWDLPTYKLWIPGGLSIHSYGWQTSLTPLAVKANATLTKELQFSQNKEIPYLGSGNLEVSVGFKLKDHEPRNLSGSVNITISDEAPGRLQKRELVSAAKKFSEESSTETVIDYRSGFVTDHMDLKHWTVSFDNKGPKMFGVTEINVDKETGVASWPSHETLVEPDSP